MNSEQFVYGRNAVHELLEHRHGNISKIYIRNNVKGGAIQDLVNMASSCRVPVQRVPGKKLADMVGSVNDQGVVASVSEAAYIEMEDWLEQSDISLNPVIIALDEIEDPHNFGAVVRTALACGIDAVMVPKHRQAPMSGGVFKASAGAILRMPVIRVVNLNQSLMTLKKSGFWILGTNMESGEPYWHQDYNIPMVVVLGSEEKGIRKKTKEHCDLFVHIPMLNDVESLNASVSSALISYEILRQRQAKPE